MGRWPAMIPGLIVLGGTALAQPPEVELPAVLDSPMYVVLTPRELAAVAGLDGARDRARLLALCWARRDPDPTTPVNEFLVDLEARIAAADRQFSEVNRRGASTDRGRVLLLLGRPDGRRRSALADELERLYRDQPSAGSAPSLKGIAPTTARTGKGVVVADLTRDVATDAKFMEGNSPVGDTLRHGVRFSLVAGRAEVWTFAPDLPDGAGSEPVTFTFFDHFGSGRWQLQTDLPGASAGLRRLELAPALSIAHQDLVELPDRPLFTASSMATREELRQLDTGPDASQLGVTFDVVRGARSARNLPAWIVAATPPGFPRADRIVGRVLSHDGTCAGSFRLAVSGTDGPAGSTYEIELPVGRSAALIDLALATAEGALAAATVEVERTPARPEHPFLTEVVAGGQVSTVGAENAHAPFTYGGFHLQPRPGGRYGPDEALSFFCLLVRPQPAEGGEDHTWLALRLVRDRDHAVVLATDRREITPSAVTPGVFMVGSQIPRAELPIDGPHHLEIEVHDEATGLSRTSEVPILPES